MSTPLREQIQNNASTTLDGAINNSVTSVDVTDGSVFPATGNFRVIVEDEIMLVTARSSDTLTVVRGSEGTAAASHADLKDITLVLTTGSFNALGKDNLALFGWSSAPPLNKIVADNGSTILTTADFTTLGSNSTYTDQNGTIINRQGPTASGNEFCGLYKSAPSAPWVQVIGITMLGFAAANNYDGGMIVRESGTGKFLNFCISRNGNAHPFIEIQRWTNATNISSFSLSGIGIYIHSDIIWFKIEDNSTNLKFSMSNDGVEWIELLSESRTAFLAGGPDQLGWGSAHNNAIVYDSLTRLVHWSRQS